MLFCVNIFTAAWLGQRVCDDGRENHTSNVMKLFTKGAQLIIIQPKIM
jgi:hypothetical protein